MNTPNLPPWRQIYDKFAPLLALLALLFAIAAGVGTYVNDRANARQDRERIEANEANAVTSCENANETREASRTLWNFALDNAEANNPDAPPEVKRYLQEFRAYVDAVYAPRDCSDLSKKYPLPEPPEIPTR